MFCNLLILLLAVPAAFAKAGIAMGPEYLDSLLAAKQYEEFAEAMGIENVDLVRPAPEGEQANPMFNKDLQEFDILLTEEQKEQSRQGIRFDRHPSYRWPGEVVYWISRDFNGDQRQTIESAINDWNRDVPCIKWRNWRNYDDNDWVHIFPGRGCYSYLGRIGGEQALSLQSNGCVYRGTILHEMDHAIGFAHEQNRWDRDNHIEMLWHNIPDDWKSQYEKTNPNDFGLQQHYDYYSIMHYPVNAPGTNKPAFRVKQNGIDENRIGRGNGFTNVDINKIRQLYC